MVWSGQTASRRTGKSRLGEATSKHTARGTCGQIHCRHRTHSTAEAEEGSASGGSQTDSRAARGVKRESGREREKESLPPVSLHPRTSGAVTTAREKRNSDLPGALHFDILRTLSITASRISRNPLSAFVYFYFQALHINCHLIQNYVQR